MATRYLVLACAAVTSIAGATIAHSTGTQTEKRAKLHGIPAASTATAPAPAEQTIGRLIVKLRDGGVRATVQAGADSRMRELESVAGVGLSHVRDLAGGATLMALGQTLPLSQAKAAAARLASDPDVEFAEPDVMMKKAAVPNDPRFSQWQWNLFEPTSIYSGTLLSGNGTKSAPATGGANLPSAWDVSGGGSSAVVVAIIDTGIVNHPDLNGLNLPAPYTPTGRFVAGYDFISSDVGATDMLPENFVANDGDGRDPDPTDPGDWITAAERANFPNSTCADSPPSDSSWHGTHMAGIAAASVNNGLGIAGIGWNVRVQPIRALGKCGGSLSDISEAIRWAAGLNVPALPANGTPARVISLSLGGSEGCSNSMQSAVDAANAAGSVVVAATGNEGNLSLISPANCNGVIAVTAHTINGDNADYANIGPRTSISAPGGGPPTLLGVGGTTDDVSWYGYYIWSTLLFGATTPTSMDFQGQSGASYGGFTGTSAATPQVASVAGLMKSVQPDATAPFIRAWLTMSSSVRPHPVAGYCSVYAKDCGHGLLDANKAVLAAVDAVPVVAVGAANLVAAPGTSISFSGTVMPYTSPAVNRTIATAVWSTTAGTLSSTSGSFVTLTAPAAGFATVTLFATDNAGKSAFDSVTIRVNRAPTLLAVSSSTAAIGETVSFVVGATDADGDPLTFVASSLPPGATLLPSGQFTWNTAGSSPGTYSLVYSVSDPFSSTASATVTITLVPGGAPPPTGGGGGGGALPPGHLLLLASLLLAARVRRRE